MLFSATSSPDLPSLTSSPDLRSKALGILEVNRYALKRVEDANRWTKVHRGMTWR